MRVLGVDSAGTACSAALWWDGRLVAQSYRRMDEGQAASLIPMIAAVMESACARSLDAVAVTVGPGSFTGIRIGLAAALGIALAAAIKVVGLTTLEAVAHAADAATDECLLVALESKRAELFVQCFDSARSAITEPASVHPAALLQYLPDGSVCAAGDGRMRAVEACRQAGRVIRALNGPDQPHAATVARLAAVRMEQGQPLLPPVPFYLRAPDVRPPQSRSPR